MSPMRTVPPIPWQAVSLIPLPEVFIDDSPAAWLLWDAAVRALDRELLAEAA